ncbi:restriction endonuclease subunit S [Sorangium sp. So ce394]|uniref:restriction endonuclease subunit S n=1 Tax=Sorangium sp. So ce394 TaxID=3133310 RepID=UPI003F5B3F13
MARNRLYPPSVDPGFPELPPTPSGWNRSKFKNLVDAIERPIKLGPDSTYRLLTAKRNRGGITLRGELKGREILTKTQFEAHAGDFLISRRQIIHGACGVVPEALHGAVVSNEYSTLRTRTGFLMDFLRHLSHTAYFQRTCFHSSHGVDVEKMVFKLDQWLDWPVNVPPIGEQRKIAAILSAVDDAIETTQAVIDQLQVVKKAMMAELLTRGLPGRHTRFKKTEIGEVPEEWEVVPVSAVAEVTYGLTVNSERRNASVRRPYLTVANLQEGGFDLREVKSIGVLPGDVERFGVKAGDLLVVEGNANILRLGQAAVWKGEIPGALHQNHLIRIRPTNPSVISNWLTHCFNGERGRQQLESCAKTSSGLHTINSRVVSELRIGLPNLQEQEAICGAISAIDERIEAERVQASSGRSAKSALLSSLLTGEIRVTPDEASP